MKANFFTQKVFTKYFLAASFMQQDKIGLVAYKTAEGKPQKKVPSLMARLLRP